jgi:hypothetical protein
MIKTVALSVCVLGAWAGASAAFEVEATIKKVDAANRRVTFTTGQQDRTAAVAPDAKILAADGQDLADGLAAKDLKEGALVTLSVERVEDRPVIRAIRLGGGVAGAGLAKKAEPQDPSRVEKQDTSNLIPLTDLGTRDYQGFAGGLYPDGKNTRPTGHDAAGRALAAQVRPLDAEGRPSPDGKIVLLGIGFSNTVQAFGGFMQVAKGDPEINPKVVLVNGAVGGMSAAMVQDPDRGRGQQYWATVDERLKAAGVSRAQVQVVWIKETNPAPHEGGFPKYVQDLQAQLVKIVGIVHDRFPNAKLAYFSSRTYGGWAMRKPGGGAPGNSEPFSYESGFAVKWLIERQLKGDPEVNYDAAKGTVKSPWLSWGPYLWANAPLPRGDGVRFELADFSEKDRMHESPAGQVKVGKMLLQFFKTDPTTRTWFVRDGAGPGPSN